MCHIERTKRLGLRLLFVAGCLSTAALLYGPLPGFWSSLAWGQQALTHPHSPGRAQAEPKRRSTPVPSLRHSPSQELAPDITPVALPVAAASLAFRSAVASCDKAADGFKPVPLPGKKGEVNLDSCYRGREHLDCTYDVLLTEAKSLLQNYSGIVQANYSKVANVRDICKFKFDTLEKDLRGASEFVSRFRTLNAEYDARISCSNKIAQSLNDLTLPGLNQSPNILKSMSESLRHDMSRVSEVEAQVVDLDKGIEASQNALALIQKIHRVACLTRVTPDPALLAIQKQQNAIETAREKVAPGFCGYQTVRTENGVWTCRR